MDWQREFQEAMRKTGTKSRYALAKRWGLTYGAMIFYRRGNRTPDNNTCFLLAEATGKNALLYITAAEEIRARNPERKALWRKRRLAMPGGAQRKSKSALHGVNHRAA